MGNFFVEPFTSGIGPGADQSSDTVRFLASQTALVLCHDPNGRS